MDTERRKLIDRNQKIVVGFIILTLTTTVLFLRYEGEKLLDIAMPQKQVTYYKISELKQEDYIALPPKITVYIEQCTGTVVKESNSQSECNKEDIKVYE